MSLSRSVDLTFRRRLFLGLIVILAVFARNTLRADNTRTNAYARARLRMQLREQLASLENRKRELPPGVLPEPSARAASAANATFGAPQSPGLLTRWYSLGPGPIGQTQNNFTENVSGRVTCLAVDPFENYHWLIGAAQGGIWGTTNSGSSWDPLTDDQPSLAMGAIAFSTGNPNLVYAGTGEANFSADSYAGQGLLVSRDRGFTWQMVNTNFAESSFSGILVDFFGQTNHLVVSTTRGVGGIVNHGTNIPPNAPARGVFVSTTGGVSFNQVLHGEATDIKCNPFNFADQYAGLGEILGSSSNGVYRTTNGWATSQRINGPWYGIANQSDLGRVAFAISSDGGVAYVAIAYTRDNPNGDLVGIWMTSNPWASSPSWTQLASVDNGPFLWYSFALTVDPNDPNSLYYAGIDVLRHTFPADTWQTLTGAIHPDQHAMAWIQNGFDTSSYKLLVGDDGGVWQNSAYPPGLGWFDMNNGISTAQAYRGAVNPDHSSSLALAGLQDNGTVANGGSALWPEFSGGDGCDCAIASSGSYSNWAFSAETLGFEINLFRTEDGGQLDFQNASFGIDPANAGFFVHFEKSPRNDDLFIAGTAQLWRCDNFFSGTSPTWVSNSPVYLDTNSDPASITSMAFAPSDTNGMIYAFGTEDGQLLLTTNGGSAWRDENAAATLPRRFVSGIAFSPTVPSTLYVTYSGFNAGTPGHSGHLFVSSNAFASPPTWTDISPPVDLPNNCLAIDPTNPNKIYVGTDTGVWFSINGGGTWTHQGPEIGMPNVAVFDLRMDNAGQPTAFTHGRGVFTLKQGIPIINPNYRVRNPRIPIGCLTCPPEVWFNPGDEVQAPVTLQDSLPIDTVDLVGTLVPSSYYSAVSGPQTYGAMKGLGASVTRTFSLRVNAGGGFRSLVGGGTYNCGDEGQFMVDLADQGVDLGQVAIPFRVGVPNFPLGQDFTGLPAGSVLPTGWTSTSAGADVPWMVVNTAPPNEPLLDVPDSPEDVPPPNNTIEFNAFTPSVPGSGQSYLVSAPFTPLTSQAQLFFRQAYDVSNQADGCILEISSPAAGFTDILQAGGSFAQYGYNVTLSDRNPMGPRPAWSGNSGGWLPVKVNLPPSTIGQSVQLRWHFATSSTMPVPGGGWFIDAVSVSEAQCLPPVSDPVMLNPRVSRGQFEFDISTAPSRYFYVDYKTNLNDTAWTLLTTLNGDGTLQTVSNTVVGASQTYYRFRVQ